jgi:hypothetical protein
VHLHQPRLRHRQHLREAVLDQRRDQELVVLDAVRLVVQECAEAVALYSGTATRE